MAFRNPKKTLFTYITEPSLILLSLAPSNPTAEFCVLRSYLTLPKLRQGHFYFKKEIRHVLGSQPLGQTFVLSTIIKAIVMLNVK
jgi:hypothetical protein